MNKNTRNLYFYFGRNDKHDYIATPMSNAIMIGQTGSGKTCFLNNAIIRLIMECNPKELSIDLITLKEYDSVWSNAFAGNRVIPQLTSVRSLDSGILNYIEQATKCLQEIWNNISIKLGILKDNNAYSFTDCNIAWKQNIFVFEYADCFFENMTPEMEELFENIVKNSEKVGVYIVLIGQGLKNFDEERFLQYFPTKIASRVSDKEYYNTLFDNRSVGDSLNRYGDVMLRHYSQDIQHLYIPFYPDTWIKKFIRYYGVARKE